MSSYKFSLRGTVFIGLSIFFVVQAVENTAYGGLLFVIAVILFFYGLNKFKESSNPSFFSGLTMRKDINSPGVKSRIETSYDYQRGITVFLKRVVTKSSGHSTIEFDYAGMNLQAQIINAYVNIPPHLDYDRINQNANLKFFNESLYTQQLIVSKLTI